MTNRHKKIAVTGGAGFIGSAVVRQLIANAGTDVLNIDVLTYAGNLASLKDVESNPRYRFSCTDICDRPAITTLFADFEPDAIIHLAAESHVDRSIEGPAEFVRTNVLGTATMLQAATEYWQGLTGDEKADFRFHHVSTDEVFGALGDTGFFSETTPYDPRSPYSSSKAGSDHLVSAWHHTYGLPTVLTNCSNNYGHFQFPEKLIPLVTIKALQGAPLPVYGTGSNVRDWLFVDDHAEAIRLVLEQGRINEAYLVGGHSERTNLEVVETICDLLDTMKPRSDGQSYRSQISFVSDRPGHDFRYAIDCSKIERELGWKPRESFDTGMKRTIAWYLDNADWWQPILDGNYQGERLGTVSA